jgi:hypothetical protein
MPPHNPTSDSLRGMNRAAGAGGLVCAMNMGRCAMLVSNGPLALNGVVPVALMPCVALPFVGNPA